MILFTHHLTTLRHDLLNTIAMTHILTNLAESLLLHVEIGETIDLSNGVSAEVLDHLIG